MKMLQLRYRKYPCKINVVYHSKSAQTILAKYCLSKFSKKIYGGLTNMWFNIHHKSGIKATIIYFYMCMCLTVMGEHYGSAKTQS